MFIGRLRWIFTWMQANSLARYGVFVLNFFMYLRTKYSDFRSCEFVSMQRRDLNFATFRCKLKIYPKGILKLNVRLLSYNPVTYGISQFYGTGRNNKIYYKMNQ